MTRKETAKGNPFQPAKAIGTATISVGAQSSTSIPVSIQLKDSNSVDLAVRGSVFGFLSNDANGDSIVGTAPSGGVAIGTDGVAIPLVANKAFQFVSEADGDIDIAVVEAGTKTEYLHLVMPDGTLVSSAAITHTTTT